MSSTEGLGRLFPGKTEELAGCEPQIFQGAIGKGEETFSSVRPASATNAPADLRQLFCLLSLPYVKLKPPLCCRRRMKGPMPELMIAGPCSIGSAGKASKRQGTWSQPPLSSQSQFCSWKMKLKVLVLPIFPGYERQKMEQWTTTPLQVKWGNKENILRF